MYNLLLTYNDLCDVVYVTSDDVVNIKKLVSVIGLSVKNTQIVHIQVCLSVKESWETLPTLYDTIGALDQINLIYDLMASKKESEDKWQDHIKKILRITGTLVIIVVVIYLYHY